MLGVYELNDVSLLKAVFIWAYECSAKRYIDVRQTLGEPDPLRLRYRDALKAMVSMVIKQVMTRKVALVFIAQWVSEHIESGDVEAVRAMTESELLNLHEGNFARYGVRPSEFQNWQKVW